MFIINKKDNEIAFNRLAWLVRAISKNDDREKIQNLILEDNVFYAMDGHRLHSLTVEDLDCPNQIYKPVKTSKQIVLIPMQDAERVNVHAVIPKQDDAIFKGTVYSGNIEGKACEVALKTGSVFNEKYIFDALKPEKKTLPTQEFKIYQADSCSACLLWSEDRFAVIMPKRI